MCSNGVVNFLGLMYEYFGVGLEIQEEVVGIFPRFLRWLLKHHLSMPFRCFLEIWRLVIDNLTTDDVSLSPPPSFFFFSFFFFFMNLWYLVMTWLFLILGSFVIFQMSLNSWAGYEGRAKCERALELNGHQVLFEYGHGRYWYLGDQVLPQV